MSRSFKSFLRPASWLGLGLLLLLSRGQAVRGDESTDVIKVEEDWELVIAEPDTSTDSPQITCVFAPTADVNEGYAAFDLNHRSEYSYVPGGLQLHVWNPNQPIVVDSSQHHEMLSHDGETVTWTQRLRLTDHVLSVRVKNGHSETWGDFGAYGDIVVAVYAGLDNLNGYSPDVSVANSGVSFGGNRVVSLTLKKVRWYSVYGLLNEDDTPRQVHPQE